MNWTGALIRGARTFFQSFGGALTGVTLTNALSKTVAISLGMELLATLLAAGIAGLSAFAMNLGQTSTPIAPAPAAPAPAPPAASPAADQPPAGA